MACLSGDPIEITSNTPKDVQPLRKDLIAMLREQMGAGATQFGGQLNADYDQNQLMSSAIMTALMGGDGYSAPNLGGWNTGGGGGGAKMPKSNPLNRPRSPYNPYGGDNSFNGDYGGGIGPNDPTLPSNPYYPGGGGPNIPRTKPIFIGGQDPGLPPRPYDPFDPSTW